MRTKDLYKQEVERLEARRKSSYDAAKKEIKAGYEYIKPVNVLKRTLSQAARSPEIQGDLLKIVINTGAAFLTKKIIVGDSKSPLKTWLASFIQATIAKLAGKNEDNIKLTLTKVTLSIINKMQRKIKKTPSPDGPEGSESNLSKSAA